MFYLAVNSGIITVILFKKFNTFIKIYSYWRSNLKTVELSQSVNLSIAVNCYLYNLLSRT